MTVTIRNIILASLMVVASAVTALADITGGYYAYGRNADGSAYNGTVQIGQNADGSFSVAWSVGTNYAGTGHLSGHILTVNWGSTHPAFYIVMPDGELHGTWGDGTGLELLTRTAR